MITGRYRGYLSRKSYWKQNTAASGSQQHAHITVVCLPFSARFSNRRLLWLNFITSYTVLTADVFSSVYSLVIFRLYPPLCAFPRTSCFSLPVGTLQWEASVGQKGWGNLRRVGGSSVECPQRGVHTWTGTKGKLVLGPWPECLGWEQFLEELLPGTHSLEDRSSLTTSPSLTPYYQHLEVVGKGLKCHRVEWPPSPYPHAVSYLLYSCDGILLRVGTSLPSKAHHSVSGDNDYKVSLNWK